MRYVLPCVCFAAVCLFGALTRACAAPAPDRQSEEAVEGPYDVTFTAAARGPAQTILLDWSAGAGLSLTLETKRTVLAEVGKAGTRVLATGPAPGGADFRIKRRYPAVTVYCGGAPVLAAFSARALSGAAAPAAGAKVKDFRVQPVEPADFHDEFFDPSGGASLWQPVSGQWKIGTYLDPLKALENRPIAASWYQCAAAGDAVSVTGYDFWDPCDLRVAVHPTAAAGGGLVFGYHNAGDYGAVVLRPTAAGSMVLESVRRRGGKTTRSALGKPLPWRADNWYDLVLRPTPAGVQVTSGAVLRATLPADAVAPGKVGLIAAGTGEVRFDDFAAVGVQRCADGFGGALSAAWAPLSGKWSTDGRGAVRGSGGSPGVLLRRADFSPNTVEARPVAGKGLRGVVLNWRGKSGYYLGLGTDGYSLCRVDDGKATVLARAPARGSADLQLTHRDGRLSSPVLLRPVYDFGYRDGSAGLCVEGSGGFDGFSAAAEQEPLTVISRVTGVPTPMPGENADTRRFILGYVWGERGGDWQGTGSGEEARLRVRPAGQRTAELWYYRPCPGDAVMSLEDLRAAEGATAGVAVGAETAGRAVRGGYRAELSANALKLYRGEQCVAEQALGKPAASLRLWRDGSAVAAEADGAGVSFDDPQPLSGSACGCYVRGGEASVREAVLGHRRAAYYAFRSEETDWQPADGEWMTHSGMACIPWDYWYTGKGKPQALALNVRPLPANLHLDLWVGEYTEGYADGEHRHFPYHDVSVVTSCSGGLDSGYRFLIGAEGGTVTRLLRQGKVVAETRGVRIVMGGHCNTPRELHVLVHQENGALSLNVDGETVLEYKDPQPLGGGYVGIGTRDCAANFRDLWCAGLD